MFRDLIDRSRTPNGEKDFNVYIRRKQKRTVTITKYILIILINNNDIIYNALIQFIAVLSVKTHKNVRVWFGTIPQGGLRRYKAWTCARSV